MTYYPVSTILPIYGVFAGVGIILTTLRIWVRIHFTRDGFGRNPLGIDDLCIVLGIIVVCTCTAIQFYNGLHGTGGGALTAEEKKHEIIVGHKIDFTMMVIEKLAFGAIKLSLLFFYRRIFGFWPSFRLSNYTLIVVVAAWTLAFAFADLLLCGKHISMQWRYDQNAALGHCGNRGALLIAFAVTSVVTDATVLALPLPYIGRLQMPPSKKIATSFIFLLGGISTFAGIFRAIFLCISYSKGWFAWGYTAPAGYKEPLVLQIFNPTFWVMMEMYLGVWAANLPALAPLMRSVSAKYKASAAYRKLSFTGAFRSSSTDRSRSIFSAKSGKTIR